MPFSERLDRELANRHRLWDCRDLHRIPPVGIYQRRDHACFVRRFGLGFLSGNKPDLDGDVVFDPLCLWRGVGEQDAKRKGGFRYSGRMVAGYGFGRDFHLSYPGVRPESIRLFIWQYINDLYGRYLMDFRVGGIVDTHILPFPP